jgi:Domain of unknown function (DUF1840)
MLIVFSSSQDADLIMLEPVARHLLKIVGKAPPQGILQGPDLAVALQQINAAIDLEQQQLAAAAKQAQQKAQRSLDDEEEPGGAQGRAAHKFSLKQRAYPLINMLRRALEHEVAVTWQSR